MCCLLNILFGLISGTAEVLRCSKSQENACEEACLHRPGLGSPLFTTCGAVHFESRAKPDLVSHTMNKRRQARFCDMKKSAADKLAH